MRLRPVSAWILNVILLVSMLLSVYASVYNIYYGQASPVRAETPKVTLQQGTVGTSTIYTNNTSAKVIVSAPLGVAYGQTFKSSDVRVTTTSGSPVDDSEAVLDVTFATDSSVAIIYNAGNKRGSTENFKGKGCAINVDGVDVAFSWQSPHGSNYANSVTVVYATSLTAGSHVIKGRFFANIAPATVGIDTRQIAVFWFPNAAASYVRSTTASTTASVTPVDDLEAILTFALSNDSVAFIIYNAGNRHGSREPTEGKGVTINIDGTDVATRQWQSPNRNNHANSATIIYVSSLRAGSHTVKGRFFSNEARSRTTIDERQLMVLNFPANLITYGFVQSTTSVSTTSGTPVDDPQAILSTTLAVDSDVLMMYVGGNPYGAVENYDGKGVQLQIDGVGKSNSTSWQSPYDSNNADSATSLWYEQLTAGSHTVKGKFFANNARDTITISHRQLAALAFPKPTNYNYVLKTVNQVADTWKIRLRAYDQPNIGRLSNCTIYLYNDAGFSGQIYILNGAYNQQFGDWYDLAGLGTINIAMIVSANNMGTSQVYVYLDILVPSTSTYNLMVITFEIS